jgi:hypothetical protein
MQNRKEGKKTWNLKVISNYEMKNADGLCHNNEASITFKYYPSSSERKKEIKNQN